MEKLSAWKFHDSPRLLASAKAAYSVSMLTIYDRQPLLNLGLLAARRVLVVVSSHYQGTKPV
jgi:hypothetical protein